MLAVRLLDRFAGNPFDCFMSTSKATPRTPTELALHDIMRGSINSTTSRFIIECVFLERMLIDQNRDHLEYFLVIEIDNSTVFGGPEIFI